MRRMYLEFRKKEGWDEGLDKVGDATSTARTSLIAHVVQQIPYPEGPGDNGMRVCFKGQVFVPIAVDSDLEVPGTPYTVRVVQADLAQGYVIVKVTRSSPRSLVVEPSDEVEDVEFNPHIPELVVTPCGDRLRLGVWQTTKEVTLTPTSWGFGGAGDLNFDSHPPPPPPPPAGTPPPPAAPQTLEFRWFVGDVRVPEAATAGLTRLPGCRSTQGALFDVWFEHDAVTRVLHLKSSPGDKCAMPVRAELDDNVRGWNGRANYLLEVKGSYRGYPPSDIAKLARCGARLASELRIPPDIFRPPRPPGDGEPHPNWAERIHEAVGHLRRTRPEAGSLLDRLSQVAELAQAARRQIE